MAHTIWKVTSDRNVFFLSTNDMKEHVARVVEESSWNNGTHQLLHAFVEHQDVARMTAKGWEILGGVDVCLLALSDGRVMSHLCVLVIQSPGAMSLDPVFLRLLADEELIEENIAKKGNNDE